MREKEIGWEKENRNRNGEILFREQNFGDFFQVWLGERLREEETKKNEIILLLIIHSTP